MSTSSIANHTAASVLKLQFFAGDLSFIFSANDLQMCLCFLMCMKNLESYIYYGFYHQIKTKLVFLKSHLYLRLTFVVIIS